MDNSLKNIFNTVNSYMYWVYFYVLLYTIYGLSNVWPTPFLQKKKKKTFFFSPQIFQCDVEKAEVLRGMETLVAECQALSQLLIMFHITM